MSESSGSQDAGDPFYARWSYEQLLLRQAHIRVGGLWKTGQWFYAVCPDLSGGLTTQDGQPLEKWFDESGRGAGTPIRIVSTAPEGAVRVSERTAKDICELRGAPLTVRDAETCLAVALPRGFPEFRLETTPPDARLYVSNPLTAAQRRILEENFEPLRGGLRVTILVDAARATQRPPASPTSFGDNLYLVTSKQLPSRYGREARSLLEEDEEVWFSNREKVLATNFQRAADLLPDPFRSQASRCLVDASVFPTRNLRTYLSLYRKVVIVMPLADAYARVLKALRATEDEVVELAHRGRVQFLLPQPLVRYPQRIVERLAELEARPLLLSRRLAAATIADSRRRIPLLYPPFGVPERRQLLEGLSALSGTCTGKLAKAIAGELGRIWSSVENTVQFRGAMATGFNGVGALSAAILKELTGQDRYLELCVAASSVEWAGALKATLFPVQVEGYSEQAFTELCASLYSGVDKQRVPTSIGDVEAIVEGLLALDDDAPILEVEQAFSGDDVERLNGLVCRLAGTEPTAEALREAISRINSRVKAYEQKTERQNRVDLVALAAALGAVAPSNLLRFSALGVWLYRYLFQNAEPESAVGKLVVDWIRGLNAWATSDVVLVSRIRRNLP